MSKDLSDIAKRCHWHLHCNRSKPIFPCPLIPNYPPHLTLLPVNDPTHPFSNLTVITYSFFSHSSYIHSFAESICTQRCSKLEGILVPTWETIPIPQMRTTEAWRRGGLLRGEVGLRSESLEMQDSVLSITLH